MNRHWVTLEYPEILKRLAQYTDFSGGAELASALLPTSDHREARERLALTREACLLLDARPDLHSVVCMTSGRLQNARSTV